ncbi:MAG: NYN domain-containing protein [Gemmatimonadota bacterium]|nr:MAG: NYN domain-containing protein [Gemmatimonadota bacterium]
MDKREDSPDRRGEPYPEPNGAHQAALLIDFDNVTMGIRSNLGQELRNLLNSDVIRGKVAVQRAYADWRRYPQYIVPLSEASIDLIFAPAYGSSKKNATDIRLAIDALELVFVRPEIRTFILMSGDSDFSSLVLKLKEYGKYVVGVGIQESSSDVLVQNCDEYYSYSSLSGLSRAGDQPLERHDPWVLAGKAVKKMVERGDTMRSDRLKQVMLEIDPSFSEKEQGFTKFNRFVVEAASRGLLAIQKMENGQYGVAPGGEAEAEKAEKVKERRARPPAARGAGRREREREAKRTEARARGRTGESDRVGRARPKLTMEMGLRLLRRALEQSLEGETGSIRDSDVKRRILEIDPDFDEGELGFSKFSKFLQAAAEAEAIELTRGPNGNFQVGLPKPSKGRRTAKRERGAAASDAKSRQSAVHRLTRLLFGDREHEPEEKVAEPQREAEAAKTQPAAAAQEVPKGRRGGRGRRGAAAEAPSGKTRRGPRSPGRAARGEASAPRRGAGRRGEGRGAGARRRAERGSREERKPVPEPEQIAARADVEVSARPKELPATVAELLEGRRQADEEKAEPISPAPLPGAPRGTIRGRWGTRGRYRPAGAPPPIFEGQKGLRGEGLASDEPSLQVDAQRGPDADVAPAVEVEAGSGPVESTEGTGLITRLTRYPGVGGRTARTLVEAFGADVFRVLDEEPERVQELLPDHRAERVLQARREEREAGRA